MTSQGYIQCFQLNITLEVSVFMQICKFNQVLQLQYMSMLVERDGGVGSSIGPVHVMTTGVASPRDTLMRIIRRLHRGNCLP